MVVTREADGDPSTFSVIVRDARGETRHSVTMTQKDLIRLSHGHDPADIVQAAFRFLLDREPKESILARFDVSVIARYFPQFEERLPGYLKRTQNAAR
ncbi:MAG: hypothetical protein CTY15_08625 [Methylocystis sp.]|nr:MAG: hypothetical protein CTY15_08625 [Methylocystis sp.]